MWTYYRQFILQYPATVETPIRTDPWLSGSIAELNIHREEAYMASTVAEIGHVDINSSVERCNVIVALATDCQY